MGILGRLSTLIKSNINDAIDSMQDPGKEIDQMVVDMEDASREARSEVASCIATEKMLVKRVQALGEELRTWDQKAELAVKSGQDDLAREALRRKAEKETERLETEKSLQEQRVQVDQLTAALKALELRVKDVKLRQGTLRERARMAKKGGEGLGKTSAFDDFDRMSSKIDAVEAEASLDDELAGRNGRNIEAERKLEDLSRQNSIDDALAQLKKKLEDK